MSFYPKLCEPFFWKKEAPLQKPHLLNFTSGSESGHQCLTRFLPETFGMPSSQKRVQYVQWSLSLIQWPIRRVPLPQHGNESFHRGFYSFLENRNQTVARQISEPLPKRTLRSIKMHLVKQHGSLVHRKQFLPSTPQISPDVFFFQNVLRRHHCGIHSATGSGCT